jgi:hypothetical protein
VLIKGPGWSPGKPRLGDPADIPQVGHKYTVSDTVLAPNVISLFSVSFTIENIFVSGSTPSGKVRQRATTLGQHLCCNSCHSYIYSFPRIVHKEIGTVLCLVIVVLHKSTNMVGEFLL